MLSPSLKVGGEKKLDLYQHLVVALEVEVLQGVDGVVGVTPAAGGVVEALVGEEVLIGGVE